MSPKVRPVVIVFMVALIVRLFLLYFVYGEVHKGTAAPYFGSAAIGVYNNDELTISSIEVQSLQAISSNLSGDFRDYFQPEGREKFTEFMPGPAVLLALLWKVVPIYNFAPYLVLQAVIDALLISMFATLVSRKHQVIAKITTVLMIVNVPVAKRTLVMGYDFWPQFAVLVIFLGLLYLEEQGFKLWLIATLGTLAAIPIWFREITTLLPFAVSVFILYALRKHRNYSWTASMGRLGIFLLPTLVSIALLSAHRFDMTGSYRPTRSTFWHSFMAGVGQFSNPYGIEHDDRSVWEFAKKINPELSAVRLVDTGLMPTSPYEKTLEGVSKSFIQDHPFLFARNLIYRIGIMIAPTLYPDGDFLPSGLRAVLVPLSPVLFILWGAGMLYLYRTDPYLFGLALTIYLYFFLAFGWFYVVGRVILPYMFISLMVWIAGALEIRSRLIVRIRRRS